MRLAALDLAAARIGLQIGMALADARAIVPGLRVTEIDRRADAACLHAAAAACERFTPLVALDGAAGLMLDITGCAHLFGGEAALRRAAGRRFAAAGLTARAAIAGTPDAARAFVRFSGEGVVPPGAEAVRGRALPVAALESPAETAVALARAGLRTLGDLADRPPAILAARFGAGPVTALRRILGREDARITPLRHPPDCKAEAHFPEPLVALPSLLAVLERLAGAVVGQLEQQGRGGRVFETSVFRADGAVRRLVVETARGTRDPAALMRLLALRIETLADPIDPGFGFDAVRLAVTRSEPLAFAQPALDGAAGPAGGEAAVAALVDRLVVRFGRERVLRFAAADSHDPVRAAGAVPWLTGPGRSQRPQSSGAWDAPAAGHPPLRPLTLFDPPQCVEAMAEMPDGPPLRFRWRRALHEVARAEGPERIAPEWWLGGAAAPATRDYYRVEDAEGHRFWLFREDVCEAETPRPRWFLHGLFA